MTSMPDPIAVPRGGLDLLVRAALAPEAEAREAWRRWRAEHDLDTTSWSEVRMLAAVAGRIGALEEHADVRPRVEGIRKFLWVHTQMCLEPVAPALAHLAASGIPVLLMKGTARVVANPAAAHERLIRDVDALVPLGRQEQALEALQDCGWKLLEPPWVLAARMAGKVAGHHAWAVAKGRSEIDLHHFSNHLNRLTGDDDGLWQRATVKVWRGAVVHLPAPADALVIAVTHGVRWSQDGAADWTVDAAALIDAGLIDWDVVMQEADSRLLHAVLHAGLCYLRSALGKPVPETVLAALEQRRTTIALCELHSYATAPAPAALEDKQAVLGMAWRRAMHRAGVEPLAAHRRLSASLMREQRGTIAPGRCAIAFNWSATDLHGWMLLRIDLDARSLSPGAMITAEIRAAGLTVGSSNGRHERMPNGLPVVRFDYTLPTALLVLRHLERLTFFLMPGQENARGTEAVPVVVSWYRLATA